MKAYKGFKKLEDGTLWCRGFPYQCWAFYANNGKNVYYEVECGGTIVESNGPIVKSNEGDGKFVCTEIRLVKEIAAPENKFDICWDFKDGCAEVRLNNKYNFIDTEGKYLSEQWFDECWDFKDGYARVCLNDKWNYISTEGKYLSEQWFDWCGDFQDGYAIVKLNGKQYKIDKTGKLIQL